MENISSTETYLIRPAVLADLPAMTTIYNHYVSHSTATFDVNEFTPGQRRGWFDKFQNSPYLLLVAMQGDDLLGYAGCGEYRAKAAYSSSVETSVYVSPQVVGRGIGKLLYTRLLKELSVCDVHRAYAAIAVPNPGSVRFHENFGYKPVAYFHQVGKKFGRYHDVQWFEKRL